MFWKNVKTFFKKYDSLKARLTFFYSLATFFLLMILTLFFYYTTLHVLYKANYEIISDEIDSLKNILSFKPDKRMVLAQKILDESPCKIDKYYPHYIRIIDQNNRVVVQTPHMETLLPEIEFFKQPQFLPKESKGWQASNGDFYLLMQSTAKVGGTNEIWKLQVARDVTYQLYIIRHYRHVLFITSLIGLFFSILLGYMIANSGMRSFYHFTRTTKNISADSLHQRIDPNSWPKELYSLGIAFNQMLDRIEIAFANLSQFSADLAHELRTPINNLMGETEIMLSSNQLLDQHKNLLESNLEELHRISQIIENLLFLARAEAHQIDIKKEILDARKEINIICEFYQAMADEKNISILCDGNANVFAHAVMFRRMISNLLSNALKYTPECGMVSFTIKEINNNMIQIILKDNGIGVSAEHLPKLFNRFYRVDIARSHYSGGSGLGLAIVKSIIDLHQGLISIMSEPNNGTQIILSLPK